MEVFDAHKIKQNMVNTCKGLNTNGSKKKKKIPVKSPLIYQDVFKTDLQQIH